MSTVNAFRAQVYKPFYSACPSFNAMDATNGGISGKESALFLRDPFGTELVDRDDPRLLRFVQDAVGDGFHLEPVNGHKGKGYTDWTDGGNIAEVRRHGRTEYFRIHDRQDTWEAYEKLSR